MFHFKAADDQTPASPPGIKAFCPACWSLIALDSVACRPCGSDIDLPPVDWKSFAGPEFPLLVRFAAEEIVSREPR